MKPITKIFLAALILSSNLVFSQWVNTNCSGSGAAYDMIEAGGKLLVARGGVYSTADGSTWSSVSTGATFGSCRTLKNFGSTLYAGYNGSSFYTSTNDGASWTALNGKSGLTTVYSTSLFKNSSVLIYGVDNGSGATYYSADNGTSWSTSNYNYGSGAQQGFEKTCYDIVELNGTLFHSTYKYLFKSTNSGATWTVVATSPTITPGSVTSLCKINGGLLLSIYGSGVYRTVDDGATWTKVLGGGLGTLSNNMTRVYYENGVAIAGGASSQVYISTDNGLNWTDISETGINTGDAVQSIQLFDNAIYVGTNTNVYKRAYTSAVGIKENSELTFSVHPNPTKEFLHLNGNDFCNTYSYKISAVNGKSVRNGSTNEPAIKVSDLEPGIYFIELKTEAGKTGITKFIKE